MGRALRLKAGDSITVFDGRGGEYEAAIQRIDKDRVDVKVGAWRDVDTEPRLRIGLIQGLPEADKMDWIIQKSVELGVAWIQPIVCDRSVVRLSGVWARRIASTASLPALSPWWPRPEVIPPRKRTSPRGERTTTVPEAYTPSAAA